MGSTRDIVLAFVFLLLATQSFSWTTNATDDATLYTIENQPGFERIKVETDFRYEHSYTASAPVADVPYGGTAGSATNLGNGAVVCPGTDVTVTDSIAGKWAYNGGFSARVPIFWHACAPSTTMGYVNQNLPITWGQSRYNAYKNNQVCFADEACWGNEGASNYQRVDFYERNSATDGYPNRRASMFGVCTGTNSMELKRGSTVVGTDNQPTTSSTTFTKIFENLVDGAYQLTTNFLVQGCEIIVREPTCGSNTQVEQIFGRTESRNDTSGDEYTFTTTAQTLTFTVQDRKMEVTTTSTLPDARETFCAASGSAYPIKISVRNSGSVGLTFTEASASWPFTASKRICDTITCTTNGFDMVINPGTSRDLWIDLEVPSTFSGTREAVIRLDHSTSQVVCSGSTSSNVLIGYDVSTECSTPAGCYLHYPEEPGTAVIEQGSRETFFIECMQASRDGGTEAVECSDGEGGEPIWSIFTEDELDARLTDRTSESATVVMNGDSGTGEVRVDTQVGKCEAPIRAAPDPFADRVCFVEEGSDIGSHSNSEVTIIEDNSATFQASCYRTSTSTGSDGRPRTTYTPIACGTINWDVAGFIPSEYEAATTPGSAELGFTMRTDSGDGSLVANTASAGTCEAIIHAAAVASPNRCEIDPASRTITNTAKKGFDIDCYVANVLQTTCGSTSWELESDPSSDMAGVLSEERTDSVNVSITRSGTGTLTASTLVGDCTADITANIPPTPPNRCEIVPASLTTTNTNKNAMNVRCYSGGVLQPSCTGTAWELSDVEGTLSERSDNSVNVSITRSGTGMLSAITSLGAGSADITATISTANRCEIDPVGITDTGLNTVNMRCYVGGALQTCTGTTDWSLTSGLHGALFNEQTGSVDVRMEETGSDTLTAVNTVVGTCSAAVTATIPVRPNRCEMAPDTASINSGALGNFGLTCYLGNVAQPSCTSATWSVSGISATVVSSNANSAQLRMDTATGSGELNAAATAGTTNLGTCTAIVTAGEEEPPTGAGCTITPPNPVIGAFTTQHFALACRNSVGATIPCADVEWNIAGIEASVGSETSTGADVRMETGTGTGTLTANTAAGTCNTNVIATTSGVNSCIISPFNPVISMGTSQQFTVECITNGVRLSEPDCRGVSWSADSALTPAIQAQDDDHAVIEFPVSGRIGQVSAAVTTPAYSCSTTVNVQPAGDDDDTSQTCTLDSTTAILNQGSEHTFTITCPDESSGVCRGGRPSARTSDSDKVGIMDITSSQVRVRAVDATTTPVRLIVEIGSYECDAEIAVGEFSCEQIA